MKKMNSRTPLISIIIPAYNSEPFLDKCLESVCNQTYKNIEIILINDGSTDRTAEIASKYSNVKVYTKSNGGLCSARNFGMKRVNGDYVIFIDSDDYVERDYVERLFLMTTGNLAEIVMCDFNNGGKKENQSWDFKEIKGTTEIFNEYIFGGICNRTVNKIYPFSLIKNIHFSEGRDTLEDAYFTSHVLEKTNKIIRIPYAGYHYVRHENSISRKKKSQKALSNLNYNQLEKDFICLKNISSEHMQFYSSSVIFHIKKMFLLVKDLSIDCLYEKALQCLNLIKNVNLLEKDRLFVNKILKAQTYKKAKRIFFWYTLFREPFKNKITCLKSFLKFFLKLY